MKGRQREQRMQEMRSNGGGDAESGGAQGGCTQGTDVYDEGGADMHTGREVSTRALQEEYNTQGQVGTRRDAREADTEIQSFCMISNQLLLFRSP